MRSTYPHLASRARQVILIVLLALTPVVRAEERSTDRRLYDAYLVEDMSVWQSYLDSLERLESLEHLESLEILYGFCGYIVSVDKEAAKPYVARLAKTIESLRSSLPAGHYEMYKSAVYVFELRLHQSFHPAKAMSLAKQATELAPTDPVVLSYYGTSLFYAPKPFGSKREALSYFERAATYFRAPKYRYNWLREANDMYIRQCKEKLSI